MRCLPPREYGVYPSSRIPFHLYHYLGVSSSLYFLRLMKSVTIKVPASTSNLGSGFDTLGLALKLYTTVRVTRIAGMGIVVAAPLAGNDGAGAKALTTAIAVELFFRQARVRPFAVEVSSKSDVPIARGLGYSATVRVGVLAALNQMIGARLNRNALLKLATELEGHPDNASPAIFGGFTVSGGVGSEVRCLRFPVSPQVKFVTLIPRLMVNTGKARELMP